MFEFDLYPEDGRSEQINQELIDITKDEEFEQALIDTIEKSDILRPRSPILREAFPAYRSGLYRLTTPVLLAQVEGVIGDALLIKNTIIVEGNKTYLRGSDGKVALSDKNKRIKLTGMWDLINKGSKWKSHPILGDMAEFMSDKLVNDRNGVLHGRNLAYGESAIIAARCLWILYYFTQQISAFEDGDLEEL